MDVVRLVAAIVLGVIVGGLVNMGLILAGGQLIPPPPGADMTSAEGISAALPLLEPRHFLFPFLAHALGTLCGAFLAVKITVQRKLLAAMLVGAFFLLGGIMAASMIPAPAWFIATDLILAYLPFAWLGYMLARSRLQAPASRRSSA